MDEQEIKIFKKKPKGVFQPKYFYKLNKID
jgi:hypothetical protein